MLYQFHLLSTVISFLYKDISSMKACQLSSVWEIFLKRILLFSLHIELNFKKICYAVEVAVRRGLTE